MNFTAHGTNIPTGGVVRLTYTLAEMNRILMQTLWPFYLRQRIVKKRIARLAREWQRAAKRDRNRHDRWERIAQALPIKDK